MRSGHLQLGIDKVNVGTCLGLDDLMAVQTEYKERADPNPNTRPTPNRNAERIEALEELVEGLTLQVAGLTKQVNVLMKAQQGH